MSEAERQSTIDKNLAEVKKNIQKEILQQSFIRSFFEVKKYYLLITETYNDVRLVGAPQAALANLVKEMKLVYPKKG